MASSLNPLAGTTPITARAALGLVSVWLCLLGAGHPAYPQAPPARPAVLLLASGPDLADWTLPRKLAEEYGFAVGATGFDALDWEILSRFNAVIVFDMSRLYEGTRDVNHVEISPEGFRHVSDLLYRFVENGGGLYVYGVSFTHMGQGWASDTLNRFLARFEGQVLFEVLRDPPREQRQPEGRQVLYALADEIVTHPATEGVRNLWYTVGPFSYGPWTRPLALGPGWTPLITTSPGFESVPAEDKSWPGPPTATASGVTGERAVSYAVRQHGAGRLVLNGGESTISFYGYGYSPYADQQWGRVGMEAGLDGVESDGLRLLVSSLRWLAEPSLQRGNLGSYTPPAREPVPPRYASPIRWEPAGAVGGQLPYRKGVIGARPELGGGAGSVADWVEAARAQGLDYLVFAGDFASMDQAAWEQLVASSEAATTPDFLAVPALITLDEHGNRFLQAGRQSWPRSERLSPGDPRRVRDHLGYWMSDSNFPFRAPFLFSQGSYPAWLHSGYSAFAVRTYQDGELIDEAVEGFLQNQEQGDRSRIVTLNLLSSPDQLSAVQDFTYIQAGNPDQLEGAFTRHQFSGGMISYVSTGPRILNCYLSNGTRQTFGDFYVPGTERWRLSLKAASDVPLKSVTIYDSTRLFRRFTVSGNTAEISVDGLHDTRRVLTVVVEDEQGGRAMTGSLETQDALMIQYFCSDRCNIMSGYSTLREADGSTSIVPASSMLYKAGRLYAGTVALAEMLPGIDGSGGATEFSIYPSLYLQAEDPAKTENRQPLHRIERPWESADGLVFQTPLAKRHATSDYVEIFGHAPYVALDEPRVEAALTQWHFHRRPLYPAPVMLEMYTRVTDPEGVQLQRGWNGFSQQWSGSWTRSFFQYVVLHADGSHEAGPREDEGVTGWRGTLQPGDAIIFPECSEGMFVLDGQVDAVIESQPSREWFRLYLGQFEAPFLPQGTRTGVRLLNIKLRGAPSPDPLGEFGAFRDQYGIAGQPPAYTLVATQGRPVSGRYLLEAAADRYGFSATIGQADLPQRLPVRVTGLSDRWTAAKVDLENDEWYPLGVWQEAAYTTVDTREGDQRLYLGNLVIADHPEVMVTLLPANADGKTHADVHNPTAEELQVVISVPVSTFLAVEQQVTVTAPAQTTVQVGLER